MGIPYPSIDPVLIQFGPFAIRWYALAYIAGLLGGWRYMRAIVRRPPHAMKRDEVDDFLVWATLGVVLGGRLGYVLFYKPLYYLANPVEILYVWQGGMSFHGGMLGVVLAIVLFCRRRHLDLLAVGDAIACVAPIGLFFGRLANFINGELYGRPAPDVPWAMVFPHDPSRSPRHPSQLYEAALEGLLLLLVMYLLWRVPAIRLRRGTLVGAFLIGYGVARITAEFFREPDAHLGLLFAGATMGQLLSLPMVTTGLLFILWPRRT